MPTWSWTLHDLAGDTYGAGSRPAPTARATLTGMDPTADEFTDLIYTCAGSGCALAAEHHLFCGSRKCGFRRVLLGFHLLLRHPVRNHRPGQQRLGARLRPLLRRRHNLVHLPGLAGTPAWTSPPADRSPLWGRHSCLPRPAPRADRNVCPTFLAPQGQGPWAGLVRTGPYVTIRTVVTKGWPHVTTLALRHLCRVSMPAR